MEKSEQKKKVTLFFWLSLFFMGVHLLFFLKNDLLVSPWIWYAGSGLLLLGIAAMMCIALLKCEANVAKTLGAVFLFFLVSPAFVFTLISWTEYKELIAYILYGVVLLSLSHKTASLIVPLFTFAMVSLSPSPSFELLFATLPLFYYTYLKYRKNNHLYAVSFILEIFSILFSVVISLLHMLPIAENGFMRKKTDIMFCTIGQWGMWTQAVGRSWYLLIPTILFLGVFWKIILRERKESLLLNTVSIGVVNSFLFLLLMGNAIPVLCMVLSIVSAWLLYDNRELLQNAVKKISTFLSEKTLLIFLFLIVTIFLNYKFEAKSFDFNVSLIGEAVRYLIEVNP